MVEDISMKKITVGLFLSLMAFSIGSSAAPTDNGFAQMVGGTSGVTLDGKALKVGDAIATEGVLKTDPNGSAVLYFRGKSATMVLAPSTQLKLVKPDMSSDKPYEVQAGQVRFTVNSKSNPGQWMKVRTKAATMGVRGTDYFATYNPLLGETEVVVYEGKVHFESASDPKDSKEIPAGYWGGVGGRFGKKIGDLIKLTPEILSALKKPVDVPAQLKGQD